MKKVLSIIITACLTGTVFAQGTIKGKVASSEGEELIGATVLLKGTTTGSMVDIFGEYKIENVAAGTYTVVSSYISFSSDSATITVVDGETSTHNFTLGTSSMEIETFTVSAKVERNNEAYLLNVKKKSSTVMEAIGAKEIEKEVIAMLLPQPKELQGLQLKGENMFM